MINQQQNFKHGYELETNQGNVDVWANNRCQARAIAEAKGYVVYSVNFTG